MDTACPAERPCRSRECPRCGPIRAGDEYQRFRANIEHYGGRVILVAVTAPGADVLPWERTDESSDAERVGRSSGSGQRRVEADYALGFNRTASARYARLWKAATVSADRLLRRHGHRGQLPRRVAVVWSLQKRGVWHVHEALPAESPAERLWSRQVVKFIDAARRQEAGLTGPERWALLEMERHFGVAPRGVYGWNFIDRNPLRSRAQSAAWASERAASYLAANVAAYLGENASESAQVVGRRLRSYVSRRLTMATGVTLGNLRRKRYLWVCVEKSLPLPESWSPELVERIWLLLVGREVAARAP